MGYTIDYNKHYAQDSNSCGKPFSKIMEFLQTQAKKQATALDLGCRQGRDAIPMAKMGYKVLAVDVSDIGISQLKKYAQKNQLDIETAVKDIVDFKTTKRFDIVLLDRVLHILPNEEERELVLRVSRYLKKSGHLLIADTPKNIQSFVKYLKANATHLKVEYADKNFLFYKNTYRLTVS